MNKHKCEIKSLKTEIDKSLLKSNFGVLDVVEVSKKVNRIKEISYYLGRLEGEKYIENKEEIKT